jgi:hypothetical protein
LTQISEKVAKTVAEPKKWKNNCTKAQFETPKIINEAAFDNKLYLEITYFGEK